METIAIQTKLKPMMRRFFKSDSQFFVIRGRKRTGKTNLMCLIMETAYELGYFEIFCGNVELTNHPFNYTIIRDLQTLKAFCKAQNGKKVFFFFDEMGKNIPKITPWAKLNVEVLKSLEVLRKYHLTFGGCFIGNSVSNQILDPLYLDAWIDKRTKTYAVVHDYNYRLTTNLHDIPKSTVDYEEYADVSFFDKPQGSNEIAMKTEIGQIALKGQKWVSGTTQKALMWHSQQFKRDLGKCFEYILSTLDSHSVTAELEVKPLETSEKQALNT